LAQVKPYQSADKDKKQEVEIMFDKISGKYDLLNKVLSMGIDRQWRKKSLTLLKPYSPQHLLDVATGTGDMVFAAERILRSQTIVGVDLSSGMLQVANKRLAAKTVHSGTSISFVKGDAENLPFQPGSFDAVTVAFGVRNFGDLQKGLRELHRVLQPGSPLVILEFTKPRLFPFKQVFNIYFKHILPLIGSWSSGDGRAYRYLYESVQEFPDYNAFYKELTQAGFERPSYKSLSLGICAIYLAFKP
jgi:demethylmenaquinone methyltransferase/2-methoxy-6-polyprenyl-1,4-benzoquinol methylase